MSLIFSLLFFGRRKKRERFSIIYVEVSNYRNYSLDILRYFLFPEGGPLAFETLDN